MVLNSFEWWLITIAFGIGIMIIGFMLKNSLSNLTTAIDNLRKTNQETQKYLVKQDEINKLNNEHHELFFKAKEETERLKTIHEICKYNPENEKSL